MTTAPLLVPLDGSSIAEQALPVAAAIARRTGTTLDLATVTPELPVLLEAGEVGPQGDPGFAQALRSHLLEYLRATAEALGTTHGLEVSVALLDGSPAQALADHARAKRVGMIVMTTHGHSGISRLWLGSVADRLLRRGRAPVLLLRPRQGAPKTEFRHTLVALDGLPEGERVLEPAFQLGSMACDARFTLVRAIESPLSLINRVGLSPPKLRAHWRDLQENSARSYLDRIAARARSRGLSVATEVLSGAGVAEQILERAESSAADLVVVGTHSARGVERMLVGSVADKVIRGASQTVLVVPTEREGA